MTTKQRAADRHKEGKVFYDTQLKVLPFPIITPSVNGSCFIFPTIMRHTNPLDTDSLLHNARLSLTNNLSF